MTLKILLIADFDVFGGTRHYFEQLIGFYTQLNYIVNYALEPRIINKTGYSPDPEKLLQLPEVININSPKILSNILNFLLFIWIQFFSFLVVWKEIKKKKIDLIVISTGNIDRYLSILAINTPCLYINHSTPQKDCKNKYYKLFLKKKLNSQKRIITVSHDMNEKISHFWGSDKNYQFIVNIYNSVKDVNNQKQPVTKNETHLKKNTILTLGHVVSYKNPEMWIKVAEQLHKNPSYKDYHWLWAGNGELIEHCRYTIDKNKMKNVSFIGYHSNVQELYVKTIIYFQPSILESFGLSVLDAMQWSIPCVVTRVGGLPELVIDGVTGFIIEDGDIDGAVARISWLIDHPDERKRMGEAGYLRYKQFFSYETWYESMLKVHRKVLS